MKNRTTIEDEIIHRAKEKGINLLLSDLVVIDDEYTIDGMDPFEWIDAMTMD